MMIGDDRRYRAVTAGPSRSLAAAQPARSPAQCHVGLGVTGPARLLSLLGPRARKADGPRTTGDWRGPGPGSLAALLGHRPVAVTDNQHSG
jgi:hypothetical protein